MTKSMGQEYSVQFCKYTYLIKYLIHVNWTRLNYSFTFLTYLCQCLVPKIYPSCFLIPPNYLLHLFFCNSENRPTVCKDPFITRFQRSFTLNALICTTFFISVIISNVRALLLRRNQLLALTHAPISDRETDLGIFFTHRQWTHH